VAPRLDKREQAIRFIGRFWGRKGYGPSIRDVADELRMSVGGTQDLLAKLERDGVVVHAPRIARSLRLVEKVPW